MFEQVLFGEGSTDNITDQDRQTVVHLCLKIYNKDSVDEKNEGS